MVFGTEDANSEGQAADEGQGSSPEAGLQTADENGLYATHGFGVEEPEIELEPGAGSGEGEGGKHEGDSGEAEQNTLEDQVQEPFHEHPRFQELTTGLKETKAGLEEANRTNAELAKANKELLERLDAREQAKQKKPDPTEDELADMMFNRPGEYHKYIQDKAVAALKAENEKEKTAAELETRQRDTAQAEQKRLTDFFSGEEEQTLVAPLLEDGSMERYLKENPGSDPIHAYNALTFQSRVDSAVAKEKAKWEADLKSKGRFSPAPGGGGAPKGGKAPKLKVTKNTHETRNKLASLF